jgi:hypothetical protein
MAAAYKPELATILGSCMQSILLGLEAGLEGQPIINTASIWAKPSCLDLAASRHVAARLTRKAPAAHAARMRLTASGTVPARTFTAHLTHPLNPNPDPARLRAVLIVIHPVGA